jgi:hypothetical protein
LRILSITFLGALALVAPLCMPSATGQDNTDAPAAASDTHVSWPLTGHAFSATKYARVVTVLPDGRRHFVRNEHYPVRIARDADGRIMMQSTVDSVASECDFPTMRTPPPCPTWNVFVIDPGAHLDTHWSAGELGAHGAVAITLSQERLESAARLTTEIPNLEPDPDRDATSVRKQDLGERVIDGLRAHGVRTTIVYPIGHSGSKVPTTLIHEIWIAPEMNLIVRVIDGDPHGEELIWGLEKISLQPELSLFVPPEGYVVQVRSLIADWAVMNDFEHLESWFGK